MKNLVNLLIIGVIAVICSFMGCQKSADPQPKKHLPEVSPLSKQDSITISTTR